jgi:hypothetical protein
VTDDRQPEKTQLKLEWVKPTVQKLDVGNAEGGSFNSADNSTLS